MSVPYVKNPEIDFDSFRSFQVRKNSKRKRDLRIRDKREISEQKREIPEKKKYIEVENKRKSQRPINQDNPVTEPLIFSSAIPEISSNSSMDHLSSFSLRKDMISQ